MFKFKKFLAVSVLTGVLVSSVGFNAYADDEGIGEVAALVDIIAEAPRATRNVIAGARATQEAATDFSRSHPIATSAGLMATAGGAVGSTFGPVGTVAGAAIGAGVGATIGAVQHFTNHNQNND